MSDLPQLRFLRRCHGEFAQNSSGKLADYIPELTKANPAHFGICIATVDGYVNERGDCLVPFTIQSISKAFVFAMALETIGADKVSAVGVPKTHTGLELLNYLEYLAPTQSPSQNKRAV